MRPALRTERLDRKDYVPMMQLFGNIPNAIERLGLYDIPQSEFRRAVTGETVREEHASEIVARWRRWCRIWITGYAQGRKTFDFNYHGEDVEAEVYKHFVISTKERNERIRKHGEPAL